MGKKGHLISFLKESLSKQTFNNLSWIDNHSFSFKFPKYDEKKDLRDYEKILIAWYDLVGKLYPGYKTARGAFLQGVYHSDFLIHTPISENKKCYRFASAEETKEKKRIKREKAMKSRLIIRGKCLEVSTSRPASRESISSVMDSNSLSLSPDPPPSNSSGYYSLNEDIEEDLQVSAECFSTLEDNNNLISTYLKDSDFINDNFNDIVGESVDFVSLNDIEESDLFHLDSTEKVDVNASVNIEHLSTFWICTMKVYVDSLLVLICEKQIIPDESGGITTGQIVIPHDVLEPRKTYYLKKNMELDGKKFLFFEPNMTVLT